MIEEREQHGVPATHMPHQTRALKFMREETEFQLGFLPTEQPHPATRGLSGILEKDLTQGLQVLLKVDDDIPPVVARVLDSAPFAALRLAIHEALARRQRIFFSGCGATGRLAILLDAAYRRTRREVLERYPALQADQDVILPECTRAVMTGGDYALVRSVEMFEDYISFGYHQMEEANVAAGDVVIAISEGGETSSVIGSILRSLDVQAHVFFVFNNPAQLLADKLERCRRVIEDPRVTCLDLCTGPMAVAGSTRMQATTTELLVVGSALEAGVRDHLKQALTPAQFVWVGQDLSLEEDPANLVLARFATLLRELRSEENVATLARLVVKEAELYRRGGRVTYFADSCLLDIFTDTTERAPTFKIPPFRRYDDLLSPAPWAFVKHPLYATPEAWSKTLEHAPNCLDWKGATYRRLGASEDICANPPCVDRQALYAFRIGNEPDVSRTEVHPNLAMAVLTDKDAPAQADWFKAFGKTAAAFDELAVLVIGAKHVAWESCGDRKMEHVALTLPKTPLNLFGHLAVKLVFNNFSTATMGLIGRLTGNWMAYVEASNKKLVDRSARLVAELAEVDYSTACIALFETLDEMQALDEGTRRITSPAARTVEKLKARH